MQENFRQFLDRLRQTGGLVDLHQPIDIRHIATLTDQAKTALYFHDVIGYDTPVVSGLIRSQARAVLSMGCGSYQEIETRLKHGIDHPIPPKFVKTSPTREVVKVGDEVSAGERIGSVGDEGRGPMLYFEVRHATLTLPPQPWLGI